MAACLVRHTTGIRSGIFNSAVAQSGENTEKAKSCLGITCFRMEDSACAAFILIGYIAGGRVVDWFVVIYLAAPLNRLHRFAISGRAGPGAGPVISLRGGDSAVQSEYSASVSMVHIAGLATVFAAARRQYFELGESGSLAAGYGVPNLLA
jgi:hypothetical protein